MIAIFGIALYVIGVEIRLGMLLHKCSKLEDDLLGKQ